MRDVMRGPLAAALALPLALSLALPGCATLSGVPTGGLNAPEGEARETCDATEAQQFIGRKASDAIGRSVLKMSGSRSLRWGGPDTAFTMDYREDRVNVIYDGAGTITRIYCG